ncbi:MAG: extracellular solute-binding protein [Oscillospiraceae bacterium]|jgi:multiple sugar transport system substrate-binding protein|nr:extracellular solute-binding protein [Oscillospiraceae bacterium]
MKTFSRKAAAVLALVLLLTASGCGAGDGKTHLTFQIWDVAQRDGMQAVCDAYTAQRPDVVIEVQVTSWNEYWTWDELTGASRKIHDATGKYGYMAYSDEQLGYWNFVYQNGGYILDPEKNLYAGYTQPATADAIKYYVNLQQNDWCPNQAYFAETSPGTAFFSEQGAMFFEGNWNLLSELNNYPNMVGKWDIAPLPKCPDPASGDGRATISNGLCYSTAAKGKNLETVKDVLRFFGSEEGQRIQGESGAAIPAYLGQEESWSTVFKTFDYVIDVDVCFDQFDYAVQYINNATRRKWKSTVADEMVRIYNGSDIDQSLARMQEATDSYVPAAS